MNTKKYLMLNAAVTTVLVFLSISEVMADTAKLFFSANKLIDVNKVYSQKGKCFTLRMTSLDY